MGSRQRVGSPPLPRILPCALARIAQRRGESQSPANETAPPGAASPISRAERRNRRRRVNGPLSGPPRPIDAQRRRTHARQPAERKPRRGRHYRNEPPSGFRTRDAPTPSRKCVRRGFGGMDDSRVAVDKWRSSGYGWGWEIHLENCSVSIFCNSGRYRFFI